MKTTIIYAIIQIAIIIGLIITEPITVLGMVVMGAIIYGAFYLLCKWLEPRKDAP